MKHKQPGHDYETMSEDQVGTHQEELQGLLGEAKEKITLCEEASDMLDSSLRELQMQRDNARGLIQETFQSYKTLLEKRQVCLEYNCEAAVVGTSGMSCGSCQYRVLMVLNLYK